MGLSSTPNGWTQLSTRVTPGSPLIALVRLAEYPPALPNVTLPGGKTAMVRSDGLVLAKKVGNDDCVRRAPARDAMAKPPTSPTSKTMAR